MLCVLLRSEKPGPDHPNVGVLSLVGQQIMIGTAGSVAQNRRNLVIVVYVAHAMAYTKGDNGRVVRS